MCSLTCGVFVALLAVGSFIVGLSMVGSLVTGVQALSVNIKTVRVSRIFFMGISKIISKFRTIFRLIEFHQNQMGVLCLIRSHIPHKTVIDPDCVLPCGIYAEQYGGLKLLKHILAFRFGI